MQDEEESEDERDFNDGDAHNRHRRKVSPIDEEGEEDLEAEREADFAFTYDVCNFFVFHLNSSTYVAVAATLGR